MKNGLLKNRNRGFTLIEIVIVIVIIAILAAVLVPSLLAWVDTSRHRTVISEADSIRNTLTAEMLEIYKDGVDINGTQSSNAYNDTFWENISEKVGEPLQCTDEDGDNYVTFTVADNQLKELTYTTNGIKAIFDGDSWTSEKV